MATRSSAQISELIDRVDTMIRSAIGRTRSAEGVVLRAARNANVDDYFIVSARTSFMNYFDGLLLPHYQERMPGLTRDQAIYQAGLAPLPLAQEADRVGDARVVAGVRGDSIGKLAGHDRDCSAREPAATPGSC